jgi:hypothetical protein
MRNSRVSLRLLLPNFVSDLRFSLDDVGHDVCIALRTGNFYLPYFLTGSINPQPLIYPRHVSHGKIEDHKPQLRVDRGYLAG